MANENPNPSQTRRGVHAPIEPEHPKDLASWKPTPPSYMKAIEPHWGKLRTFLIDSAQQFKPAPPTLFSTDKNSLFFNEAKDVHDIGQKLSAEQVEIANFWDCNPFATQTVGHLMYSVKKISPAGHWMGITGLAVKKTKQNLVEALYSYSMVSIAIFDAVIATWDEKYRSDYIRPVTSIQQSLSPEWQPLLQTPPFPEYVSGHSVISAACATILTNIYGDSFRYVDSVEKPYGIPNRTFNSFDEAANEAARSRLYGGIHFRQSIEIGKDLGKNVANHVLQTILPKAMKSISSGTSD